MTTPMDASDLHMSSKTTFRRPAGVPRRDLMTVRRARRGVLTIKRLPRSAAPHVPTKPSAAVPGRPVHRRRMR